MQILYRGRYRSRFAAVLETLEERDQRVVELCFGDTEIASYCKKNNLTWVGLDISEDFVERAKSLGFDARVCDLHSVRRLPESDVVIIAGSLYHFRTDLKDVISTAIQSAPKVIISEAVDNWANRGGVLAGLSKSLTNAGRGVETFRFDRESLQSELGAISQTLGVESHKVASMGRDEIWILKRETN